MWYLVNNSLGTKNLFFFFHRKTITALAFSSDGKYLVTGEVMYLGIVAKPSFRKDF